MEICIDHLHGTGLENYQSFVEGSGEYIPYNVDQVITSNTTALNPKNQIPSIVVQIDPYAKCQVKTDRSPIKIDTAPIEEFFTTYYYYDSEVIYEDHIRSYTILNPPFGRSFHLVPCIARRLEQPPGFKNLIDEKNRQLKMGYPITDEPKVVLKSNGHSIKSKHSSYFILWFLLPLVIFICGVSTIGISSLTKHSYDLKPQFKPIDENSIGYGLIGLAIILFIVLLILKVVNFYRGDHRHHLPNESDQLMSFSKEDFNKRVLSY